MTTAAALIENYAARANKGTATIAQAVQAMNAQSEVDTGNAFADAIDDKYAMSDVIAAQEQQIRTLTQMLRALGHYAPGAGFNG
jgi:hypothetical protein